MFKKLDPRRYLFFKIFIWFWLTLVATIALLVMMSNLTPNRVDAEPLSGYRLKNFQHLAKSVTKVVRKKPNKTLKQIVSHPRLAHHKLLYLHSSEDDSGFFNRKKVPEIDTNLLSFSHNLKPHRIITQSYYALGPINIEFQGQLYQLYEVEHWRHPPLGFRMVLMPLWLKVLVGLSASLGLSLAFSRLLMKPINALKQGTSTLAKGDLKIRLTHTSNPPDELAELAYDFNTMADKLERLMSGQKRLLADVSHELRSPLTRLQMATGLAQMKKEGDINSYLIRIEQEATNLDKMIADVLKLSRLEVQNQPLTLENINLQSLLAQVTSNAKFEAEQLNKQINFSGQCNLTVNVDAALIASAFENILRNAIKYAKNEIQVLCQFNDSIEITISDDGPGVEIQQLSRLFEPFYRISDSRQRTTGGAGLGLAIAKHAIAAHQGVISAETGHNGGLSVRITLPKTLVDNDSQ